MNDELTLFASWFGMIVGTITLAIWLVQLTAITRRKIGVLRREAVETESFAKLLSSRTTSAERRSDIYTYFTLREIGIAARRQSAIQTYLFAASWFVILAFYGKWMGYLPNTNATTAVAWFHNVSIVLLFVALVALALAERILRQLEEAWQVGVHSSLADKIRRHGEA